MAVTIGAGIATLLIVANGVFFLTDYTPIKGTHISTGTFVLYTLVMLVCAVGMWRLRYWAVLGFMVVLLISLLEAALALVRVSNLLGVLVCLAVLLGGGWLFYKLVRALSRIQMPKYSGR